MTLSKLETAILVCSILLGSLVLLAPAGDVNPEAVSVSYTRPGSTPVQVSPTYAYYTGSSVLISGTCYQADGAVQDLDGATLTYYIGNTAQGSTSYSGTVSVATSGTWTVTVTIPTNIDTQIYGQLNLTGSNDVTYIYRWDDWPWKDGLE